MWVGPEVVQSAPTTAVVLGLLWASPVAWQGSSATLSLNSSAGVGAVAGSGIVVLPVGNSHPLWDRWWVVSRLWLSHEPGCVLPQPGSYFAGSSHTLGSAECVRLHQLSCHCFAATYVAPAPCWGGFALDVSWF
jgi:hypothetical protein